LYHEKTRKILFSHEKNAEFFLHKTTTQNFFWELPEHSTIVSSWMLKSNTSAAVVAEICDYHRTCCDYPVPTACQDGSA